MQESDVDLPTKITRRQALSTTGKLAVTGVAVAAVAGAAGYFAGLSGAPAPAGTAATVTAGAQTVTQTATVTVAPQTTPEYTFYFLGHGMPQCCPFFAQIADGVATAGKLFNVKATYQGTATIGDVSAMVSNLETVIAAKPDGIAAMYTNVIAMDEPLKRAISQGIAVVDVNVLDARPAGQKVPDLLYIGEDSKEAGALGARYVVAYLAKQGKKVKAPVYLIHEPGSLVLETRAAGAAEVYAAEGVKMDKIMCYFDPEKTSAAVKDYLTAHPDTDALNFGSNVTAHYGVGVVDEMGLFGKVLITSTDIDKNIVADIKADKVLVTGIQQPWYQGYYAIDALYTYLKYGNIPYGKVSTGPTLVDKSNVAKFEDLINRNYQG